MCEWKWSQEKKTPVLPGARKHFTLGEVAFQNPMIVKHLQFFLAICSNTNDAYFSKPVSMNTKWVSSIKDTPYHVIFGQHSRRRLGDPLLDIPSDEEDYE